MFQAFCPSESKEFGTNGVCFSAQAGRITNKSRDTRADSGRDGFAKLQTVGSLEAQIVSAVWGQTPGGLLFLTLNGHGRLRCGVRGLHQVIFRLLRIKSKMI